MTDRVLWQTNDSLDEQNLQTVAAKQNQSDYVERGLSLTVDFTTPAVDVSAGHAVVANSAGDQAWDVFPDARTAVSLADGATNSVYLVVDPDLQDAVSIDARTSGTPSDPYLKLGEVDTSADTTTEANRAPDATVGSLDAGVLNNTTRFADSETGIQPVIDDLNQSVGSGEVWITETIHEDGITVPRGITVRFPNTWAEDICVKPAGDNDVFILDGVNEDSNVAPLVNAAVDSSGVAGYSSAHVVLRSGNFYDGAPPLVDGLRSALSEDEGTAIRQEDLDGSGQTWVVARDVAVYYGKHGIRQITDDTNAYVTAVKYENCWFFGTQKWLSMDERAGSLGTNVYELRGNGDSRTDNVVDASGTGGGNVYDLQLYDPTLFGKKTFLEFGGGSVVRQNVPIYQILAHATADRWRNMEFWTPKVEKQTWALGPNLPAWLDAYGTGSVNITNSNATSLVQVDTGSSSGDTMTVGTNGTPVATFNRPHPVLFANVDPDTSDIVARVGFNDLQGQALAQLIYDPNDTLGTGITSNYVFRVVDNSDGTTVNVDTGVSPSNVSETRVSIESTKGGTPVKCRINESEVASVTTANPYLHEHAQEVILSAETRTAASKRLRIKNGELTLYTGNKL